MIRGIAVPTMVWSRAARSSAAMMPAVTRIFSLRLRSLAVIRTSNSHSPDVLDQPQAQMAQRDQIVFGKIGGDRPPRLEHLLANRPQLLATGGGEPGSDRPPVVGVGHPLDEPVALEHIDEAGDVAGADPENRCELTEGAIVVAAQPNEQPHPALAKP